MSDLRALVWFARQSWRYLGCDRGSGRWPARRLYLARLVPAAHTFLRAHRVDRAEAAE